MLTNRLRPQLLAGLLIPLAIFALVQFSVAYQTAESVARGDTDRMLAASAHSIAENVVDGDGGLSAVVPPSALSMFDMGYGDAVYYRVGRVDGRLLAGYTDLPLPVGAVDNAEPRFYDATYAGQPIRLAALAQLVPGRSGVGRATIVVGETLRGQSDLSRRLWIGSAFQQFLLVTLAVILAWFALRRVLAPLLRLSDEVRDRSPSEYAPFAVAELQAELDPLVNALNGYMHRLQAQLESQRRFTANAAHQLRTPLALLRTQAAYALRTGSESERSDATRAILSTTQQITRLTNQLLSLAKAEPHGGPSLRDRTDLVAATREILEEFGPLAVDRGIDLAFEVHDGPRFVTCDRAMLRDLIVNLIDNAARYTPFGGHIAVTIRGDGDAHCLRIEDNGPGIPAASRALVFERFYRIPGRDVEGSGLGLAIVKEIVDAHGASIAMCEGSLGRGLAVEVRFAVADDVAGSGPDVGEGRRTPFEQSLLGPR